MVWSRDVFLTCMLAVHMAFGGYPPAARVDPSECRSLMDLFIVVDGSDSIAYEDFKLLQNAIASLVPQMDLGPQKARIGMLVYSTTVPYSSEHTFSYDPNYLVHAALTLEHPRDGTNTAIGIQHMTKFFSDNGRPDVPWVGIVITDGISKSKTDTIAEADRAAKMGINMFAVGIGQIDMSELIGIASTENQVITIQHFNELQTILKSMMVQICPCPVPPTLPFAKCNDGPRAIGTVRSYQCQDGYLQRGNPSIMCQPDFTWTALSPDFQCVPCPQNTPDVQYGSCGGGDYLIGTVRTYSCNLGYRGVGDPNIKCLPDATWSLPDFSCLPCGDTPLIHHGTCGGGDNIIGAVRTFTCNHGYRAIGNPVIKCLDDPTWPAPAWSQPDFQCVPCGDTPIIPHGSCGGEGYTIGAMRTFTCDLGYKAVGTPNIQCLDNPSWERPRWSVPDFQCVPCSEPPVITHGSCGGGDYIIGAVRRFTCDVGYRPMGNPEIQCLDDPTWIKPAWSQPQFECLPCGNTPVIQHGSCGGGDATIGAVRTYACDVGYRLIGNPVITCLDDMNFPRPTWSQPELQCVPCGDTPVIAHGSCGGGDFTIGAIRTFTCDVGYRAMGDPTITCLDNPDWSRPAWTTPSFECVPCGNTPVISHGSCSGVDYTIGAMRTYVCDKGYKAVGNPNIKCLDDPTWARPAWSQPDFKCVPCGDTPIIPHGSCNGKDYMIGSVRLFSCNQGYKAVGNAEIQCLDDPTWEIPQWSQPQFQCVPCGDTPVISHGHCDGGDYIIGAVRKYTCEPGYKAVGEPYITCMDDASWLKPAWTVPEFQCLPCGDTPAIPHGSCGGGEYTIGAKRTYTCNNGYKPVGNPFIQCMDDASWQKPAWSKPDFQCVPCGDTPVIPHGSCGGGEFTIGAVRTFTCNPGYKAVGSPVIRCMDDVAWTHPAWSKPELQCVPCGNTPTIPHGTCDGDDYIIGAKRQFVCNPGYKAVGNPIIQCLDDPLWDRPAWSMPDFQCVPCGETPVIPHASCGGGEYIIGAVRTFTCDVGYRAIGNLDIMCMDDPAWAHPAWSKPDFQCVPCGDTPVIPHGSCGGGEFTIGAVRTFTCNPGYKAVGSPVIRCMDDVAWTHPAWSKPELQCVPCGNTPTIPHGTCDGDDYIIGAKRQFVCNPGYKAVGNPIIQCLDDPRWDRPAWSMPDFQCIPCGETPVIPHASCGGGEYIIGAVRSFTCDVGYRAIGNLDIMCMDDPAWAHPAWSKPDFQCVPCGETPVIPHATCGGGDYTIGASRTYVCDNGYRALGNPVIKCMDDVSWATPAWSKPDFSCVACGDTPVVPYGSCGGGDYTIGALRTYTCEHGYLAVGNTDITCLDDPTWAGPRWSVPSVKCTPCGETPTILHATCGGDDFLIGTKRTFTCEPGYLPKGSPTIECLPTAQWSVPDFQCMACGSPPIVPNAYTGTGPDLIGSTREYYCETGYQMSGRSQITCLPNGQWEQPQFICEGIKPIKIPVSNDPTVCDSCRFLNGVGYNNHPFDCNQYVQCFLGTKGIEPVYRRCPFGLFWDQNVLTCRPSHEVDCPHDQCKDLTVHSYRHTDSSLCCAYWKCQNGRSYGECCGEGSSYSPALRQCVTDSTCLHECPSEDEIPVCDKRPADSETMFEQYIGNNYWVVMPCAPGTAYNPVDCECSLFVMTVPGKTRQQVCKPELYLPFTDGFADRSGKSVPVVPENVTVHQGAAYFNGRSRILINRFANVEFTGDLVIKFRYNEFRNGDFYNQLQALVTNGDCGDDPSIVIAKMPGYVLLGAKTDVSKSFAIPTLDKEWKEVIYLHNERTLEGRVCGASMSKWSSGPVAATHCSVQIGYGHGLTSYVGLIDDLYIYQCRPRESMLSIGY